MAALLAGSASAFAPSTFGVRQSTMLMMDSSKAVEAAMAASKEFGATSPEARVAWDTVEEMDAADGNRYVHLMLVMFVMLCKTHTSNQQQDKILWT